MRQFGRLAVILALGLLAAGPDAFGQARPPGPPAGGPPPPPPPPPSMPPPPPTAGPPAPPPPGPNAGPPPAQALARLSQAELARWQAGRAAFTQPADVPGGLGPVFNENSCAACHGGPGGAGPRQVIRFGRYLNGQFDPMLDFGGPTLQDRGIGLFNGVRFVGEVVPPQANVVAHRRTTPLYGLGLVEAVPDATLLTLASLQAHNAPATAGRVSVATDAFTGQSRVGRFGWKAQQPTLFDFAGDALLNEMGVTTPLSPVEDAPQGNLAILAANPARSQPNRPTNLSVQQLADFMAFNAPPPPGTLDANARAGQVIFASIGCAACHQPTLQAGPSPSAAIAGVGFAPFSDFLLHDMGTLGDGIVQGQAGPTEMRTAPLWGLRFQRALLHDGRAPSVNAAILAHAGQGAAAAHAYSTLTAAQKAQLLGFLNSL